MLAPRACLAACLASSLALAQTVAVSSADVSRGATLVPGATAFADEATSLVYNPAGLGRSPGLSVVYQHATLNSVGVDGDGLWVSTGLGDVLGLGASVEWLTTRYGPTRARSSLGLSFGPQEFSVGVGLASNLGGRADGLTGIDLAVQSRPLRWLSLAALLRNANAASSQRAALERELVLGVGLRPVGEHLSIGVDLFLGQGDPLVGSRLQYTAQAQVAAGLRVLAGVSHGLGPSEPLRFQLAVGLDLEHVGYLQGLSAATGATDWQFQASYSSERRPALAEPKKLAIVGLGGLGEASGGTVGSLLGLSQEDRYLRVLNALDEAARDPRLAGVVLKIESSGLGLARADEVRSAVLKLRAAGKKVFAYLLSANDAEYLVATACDTISAAPESMFMVDGLRSTVTFLGGAAEKLGVGVDVVRVGAFKNFPDQFTRKDMSPEHAEALNAYLDTAARVLEARVVAGRPGVTADAWHAAVDEGLKSTRRALELKQVDSLLTPKAFDEFLRAELPGAQADKRYRPLDGRDTRWGSRRQIAVVPVLGSIAGGKDQSSPLGGDRVAGAETFIEAIGQASEDEDVAAIVVRVDSGGGDGLASYLMEQAVLEAKKKKPVVASMGDVAASGGYYVATAADEIWASPATLTGSIGVFFAKPALAGLLEKLGATQVALSRGKLAGITDVVAPWSDEQRAAAQKWVDDFYDTFITEVAQTRKLDKAAVDAVARGRVWSGEDAKAKGLVDRMGGLLDAVSSARLRAGVSVDEELDVVVYGARRGLGAALLGAAVPAQTLETALPAQPVPPGLTELLQRLGPDAWLLGPSRLQTRLEHGLKVE